VDHRNVFSSRLQWNLFPNRLSELLQRKRLSGAAILDLTESNPTRAGFSYPAEEVVAAFADRRSLYYEPAPAGLPDAREAVAAYYAGRGLGVESERILLTAGTSESYAFAFKLLADPGDEVLVPRPSYPLFDFLAALDSIRLVQYPLVYDGGWSIDLEALERSLTPRSRAIIVVNPNNPTGSFLKRHELRRLARICEERGLAILSDEVFSDYTFRPDPERVASVAGFEDVLTFALSGLSKIAGLPQMKLGWTVAGGPRVIRERAFAALELISDTYLSVGTPVQHACRKLLAAGSVLRHEIAQRVRGNLEFLTGALGKESACHVLDVEGGWYATLQVPRIRSEEEWALTLLDRDAVLVQPGFFFDFESEAFLVLSLLTAPETFREGTHRLLARVEKT
jgi:aspartate/methionine/tyrosine aminotransferase